MRRLAVVLTLAAACGGKNVGPVAGAHEAFERHYPVTVAQAHDALIKVLTDKYGGVTSDDGLRVVASATCRDKDGDPCAWFPGHYWTTGNGVGSEVGGASTVAPPAGAAGTTRGSVVGHYWFQVYAGVVGTDGDVQIQLGGHAKDFKEHPFEIGAPGSPAWMPHEVDEVRVAVDHVLAAR